MDGKQLRNCILQWAIEGRLVPQCSTDEPAAALLRRIHDEKRRLVAAGQLKKSSLTDSHIYRDDNGAWQERVGKQINCIDDEIPFDVPEGWEWCRLGDIGEWGAGATPLRGNSEYYNGSILWLKTGELNDNIVHDTKEKITEKALSECSLRMNKAGDVLVAMYGATIGKLAIAGVPMTTNQACCGCTPFLILNTYLFYYLMAIKNELVKRGEGGAQPNISREKLVCHLFPLPPLPEQRRIVSRLEELLPLVEAYGKGQAALDALNAGLGPSLRRSLLQEAIRGRLVEQRAEEGTAAQLLVDIRREKQRLAKEGRIKKSAINDSHIYRDDNGAWQEKVGKQINCIDDEIPFDLPEGWEWCRLGTIFSHCTGKALNASDRDGKRLTYITTSNLYWDRFVLGELRSMFFTDDEMDKCTAVKGDLLVCEGGDVGRAAIWNEDYDIRIQNHIHKLRPYSDVCLRFFFYAFMYYKGEGYIGSKGIGIQGLSSKVLHNLLLPLPPLSEQRRIVSRLDTLLSLLP